jgi:hypothetical protein
MSKTNHQRGSKDTRDRKMATKRQHQKILSGEKPTPFVPGMHDTYHTHFNGPHRLRAITAGVKKAKRAAERRAGKRLAKERP